jgi:hypothetical protein
LQATNTCGLSCFKTNERINHNKGNDKMNKLLNATAIALSLLVSPPVMADAIIPTENEILELVKVAAMASQTAYVCGNPEIGPFAKYLTKAATEQVQAYETPESDVLEADANGRLAVLTILDGATESQKSLYCGKMVTFMVSYPIPK